MDSRRTANRRIVPGRLPLAALLIAALFPASGGPRLAAAQAPAAAVCDPKAGPARLDFTLTDMNGRDVRLDAFKGTIIVLNFWATWCVPCRGEIPDLVAIQARYHRRGVQVIGVSIDDPPEKMKPFAAELKVNYPLLTALKHEAIVDAYDPIVVAPATFLIGRDGIICTQRLGPVSKDVLQRELDALLRARS